MLAKIYRNIKNNNLIPAVKRKYHMNLSKNSIYNTIILAGIPRSGTTWLAQTLNYDTRYRLIYEPFHKRVDYPSRVIKENQYIHETDETEKYVENLKYILGGQIRHKHTDYANSKLFYRKILVKIVRGNFLLKWIHNLFPENKIIYILRHPFSTALSQQKRKIRLNFDEILAQKQLMKEFLTEPLDNIRINDLNEFEKYILYWSINNFVVLEQFQKKKIYIIKYEDIFENHKEEIKNIFGYLNQNYSDKIFDVMKIPSFETNIHSTLNKTDPLNTWKEVLQKKQIEPAIKILEKFKLDKLYDLNL